MTLGIVTKVLSPAFNPAPANANIVGHLLRLRGDQA